MSKRSTPDGSDVPSRSVPLAEQTTAARRPGRPVREFIATQNASAVVLLGATLLALLWANSPWSESYERLWSTVFALRLGELELALDLRTWLNDGLMAFFFFVAGLEIRREFDMGELRERRRVATPVIAAVGGMAVPALIYLAFNGGTPTARGWGIPRSSASNHTTNVVLQGRELDGGDTKLDVQSGSLQPGGAANAAPPTRTLRTMMDMMMSINDS